MLEQKQKQEQKAKAKAERAKATKTTMKSILMVGLLAAIPIAEAVKGGVMQPDPRKAYPYMVSIQGQNYDRLEHQCGGTVFDKDHIFTPAKFYQSYGDFAILTAAHCVLPYLHNLDIYVFFENGQKVQIPSGDHAKLVKIHKEYRHGAGQNDIAIILLPKSFPISKGKGQVMPAALNDNSRLDVPGSPFQALAIGYGSTTLGYDPSYPVLNALNLPLAQKTTCESEARSLDQTYKDPDMHICLSSGNPNFGVGKGDSGSPLITQANNEVRIIGLAAYAFAKEKDSLEISGTSAYTRISSYSDWIISQVLTKLR
mmetsp:Transcript_1561/g.3254  ORF Transcript_1561/g.3254 Transcript_1561/m.3254 type:complete len:313 (-) Transcript_1561:33-971(-)